MEKQESKAQIHSIVPGIQEHGSTTLVLFTVSATLSITTHAPSVVDLPVRPVVSVYANLGLNHSIDTVQGPSIVCPSFFREPNNTDVVAKQRGGLDVVDDEGRACDTDWAANSVSINQTVSQYQKNWNLPASCLCV